jgi:hypothetical protein
MDGDEGRVGPGPRPRRLAAGTRVRHAEKPMEGTVTGPVTCDGMGRDVPPGDYFVAWDHFATGQYGGKQIEMVVAGDDLEILERTGGQDR